MNREHESVSSTYSEQNVNKTWTITIRYNVSRGTRAMPGGLEFVYHHKINFKKYKINQEVKYYSNS